ncbi:MAG: hypothetical protein Q9166_007774 [cf. Caloplaca sp. 2 TL-2023]
MASKDLTSQSWRLSTPRKVQVTADLLLVLQQDAQAHWDKLQKEHLNIAIAKGVAEDIELEKREARLDKLDPKMVERMNELNRMCEKFMEERRAEIWEEYERSIGNWWTELTEEEQGG